MDVDNDPSRLFGHSTRYGIFDIEYLGGKKTHYFRNKDSRVHLPLALSHLLSDGSLGGMFSQVKAIIV